MAVLATLLACFHWTHGERPHSLLFASRVEAAVTSAVVTQSQVERRPELTRYTPQVFVRYQIGGIDYVSQLRGVLRDRTSTLSLSEVQAAMTVFVTGNAISVRIRSDAPDEPFADGEDWSIVIPLMLTLLACLLWPLGIVMLRLFWI